MKYFQLIKGKIFIHCYMGVSRSATFLIAYLIKYRKMKLEAALKMCIQKRLIWPNDGFMQQLIRWEKIFIS
jgi:protein-tyrosine phosphatase